MGKYVGINLKKEYAEAIDDAIERDPFIKTRAEFIRRAIESKLRGVNQWTMRKWLLMSLLKKQNDGGSCNKGGRGGWN